MGKQQVLLIFLSLLHVALCSRQLKILGLFPHPGKSHFQFFHPVLRGLAEAGHDVTVLSHFPDKATTIRYRDLPLSDGETLQDSVDLKLLENRPAFQHLLEFFMLYDWGRNSCNATLKSDALAKVLKENRKYDVIITEMFNTDCMMGVTHVLKAPVIALSSCALMPWHYERMGLPMYPSYIPTLFLGLSDNMTYLQRLSNWVNFHLINFMYRFFSVREANALIAHKFGRNIPSVTELAKNTSLFLVNQHFSLSGAKPLPPNVVEVGGLHIQKAMPLNDDVQRFLDKAVDGAILISWGSMVRANSMSHEKRDSILGAIKRLKQKVIWKWEDDTIKNKPENLMIQKWVQQREILCHPNLKVFVSHGGLMGTSEAAYCGVPTVVTPLYGDQFLNGAALVNRGMGVILDYHNIKENTLLAAIRKSLDSKFLENAKTISQSYKNRLTTSLDTTIWWVEYVAKTKGAPLAQVRGAQQTFFVYNSLDVYITVGAILFFIAFSWIWAIKKIVHRFSQQRATTVFPKKIK